MTLGMAMGGFDVVGHVEWDKCALETYEANKEHCGFGNSELIGKDITKISDETIIEFAKRKGPISMICGGPPCQSFSLAGKRELGDPRDNLFLHFVRFVNLIKPDYFCLENVPGILSKLNADKQFMIDVIKQAFELVGYKTEYALLNAVSYSVPQTRRRIFLFGVKDHSHPIYFPLPLCFGTNEGMTKFEMSKEDDQEYMYRKCSSCGKCYASHTYTKNKEPLCLFCHNHTQDSLCGLLKPSQGIEKDWLVVRSKVAVPAKPDQMWRVHMIEARGNLAGSSRFLYCYDWKNNWTWLNEREVRRIADNDAECDAAEQWIITTQIINPMVDALKSEEVKDGKSEPGSREEPARAEEQVSVPGDAELRELPPDKESHQTTLFDRR
jgi:DNA-cytosine methyltransferase